MKANVLPMTANPPICKGLDVRTPIIIRFEIGMLIYLSTGRPGQLLLSRTPSLRLQVMQRA